MERYNFDVIFEGEFKEQHCKASHFLQGLRRKVDQAEESYAHAVLVGENSRAKLAQIHELEDAKRAFVDDPRTKVLQAKIDEEDKKARDEAVLDLLKKALR